MAMREVEINEGAPGAEMAPSWPLWPINLEGFWAAGEPSNEPLELDTTNFGDRQDQPEKPKSGRSLTPTGNPSLYAVSPQTLP